MCEGQHVVYLIDKRSLSPGTWVTTDPVMRDAAPVTTMGERSQLMGMLRRHANEYRTEGSAEAGGTALTTQGASFINQFGSHVNGPGLDEYQTDLSSEMGQNLNKTHIYHD